MAKAKRLTWLSSVHPGLFVAFAPAGFLVLMTIFDACTVQTQNLLNTATIPSFSPVASNNPGGRAIACATDNVRPDKGISRKQLQQLIDTPTNTRRENIEAFLGPGYCLVESSNPKDASIAYQLAWDPDTWLVVVYTEVYWLKEFNVAISKSR